MIRCAEVDGRFFLVRVLRIDPIDRSTDVEGRGRVARRAD
jgi:hypothetical protein